MHEKTVDLVYYLVLYYLILISFIFISLKVFVYAASAKKY